jgi:hypothetical protein
VLTTFTYGSNIGPAQAARRIRGVSAHDLRATSARHFTTNKLNLAGADVVDAFLQRTSSRLGVTTLWVAPDGTQLTR